MRMQADKYKFDSATASKLLIIQVKQMLSMHANNHATLQLSKQTKAKRTVDARHQSTSNSLYKTGCAIAFLVHAGSLRVLLKCKVQETELLQYL